MNTPNVHAGRLERRVRRVGNETMPDIHGFCSFYPCGAILGVPLLRLTALLPHQFDPGGSGIQSLPFQNRNACAPTSFGI